MNDQRCELPDHAVSPPKPQNDVRKKVKNVNPSLQPPAQMKPSVSTENLFEILARVQGNRLEEQRCAMPVLPGLDPAGKMIVLQLLFIKDI